MAVLPKIVYNFNESTSTIRDYSENGLDGTATNITLSTSTRVGKDAIFNLTNSQIDSGNITVLNGVADCAIHFAIRPIIGNTIDELILTKTGQLYTVYNHTTNILNVRLTVNTGTISVSTSALTLDTWYDIDFVYESNVATLYLDGVSVHTDSSKSGVVATSSNTLYIGYNGATNSAQFLLNEFKVYAVAITTTIIDAVIADQNGINSDSGQTNNFALGDIIGTDLFVSPKYGIVTYVGTNTDFRFLPLTANISGGMQFKRCGNLWDTTRQWQYKIDNTPEMCFYDGVSLSSEVLAASKKLYCFTKNGIIDTAKTVTANYTLTDSDIVVYANTDSASFTITYPSAPITSKRYEVINIGNKSLTLAGNGKNINGTTTKTLLNKYDAAKTIYSGTEHIID